MAQTRKKRRSKHRGTAAGTIEARGRTGRKLTDAERGTAATVDDKQARRAARFEQPPTIRNAALRAIFAAVLLFVFTRIGIGPSITVGASIALCVLATLIYIPLGYGFDLFFYRRFHRRKAAAKGA